MDYTSIHIYGHLLSDDILRLVERDTNLLGNRDMDFATDSSTSSTIDYVWSSLRNDWQFFQERSTLNDQYGTRRARALMERLFQNLGYHLSRQNSNVIANGNTFDISYLDEEIDNMPFIVVGDLTGDSNIETLDRNTLDYRAKGDRKRKSPHATILDYLNSTENIYGIIANGRTIRLIRNSGQLVKLTHIEFDIQRMLEEDKYTEFCLMFRLLHSSRFRRSGDEPCIMERWFNMSIESGNRIRAGLSDAVRRTMEIIGTAVVSGKGSGNDAVRAAYNAGELTAQSLNKELIHFIYRLLFLFIIEDRNLVYQIPDSSDSSDSDYKRLVHLQDIYKKHYAASRLRRQSELTYLHNQRYFDLWSGLMDTFRLFESDGFGENLGIKPLGGVLFDSDTLHYIKDCTVSNKDVLDAFAALNEFLDERGAKVKINYSSLDVEEFGSVYEGILEMRPVINPSYDTKSWSYSFVGGLDRQSTSSYYTRPDLVQSLIRTTLEPVIKERLATLTTPEEKVKSLLSMKVCDAASGSGHIVLAMARTIAWYVCSIRTGEDNPASLDYREALREVIQKCIYAVDFNPDAVELCKVVLWIEGYCAGRPLSFLDHHIRCGNSVVGITDLNVLLDGVPKEAFKAKDDDKEIKKQIVALNNAALKDVKLLQDGAKTGLQISLFDQDNSITRISNEQIDLANEVAEISAMPENSLLEEVTKKKHWEDLMESPRVECLRRACDTFTYAFYKEFSEDDNLMELEHMPQVPYTRSVYKALEEIKQLDNPDKNYVPLSDDFKHEIDEAATKYRFFHWCVEFPEVFANKGGFDVMCGNPPWDKLQMEDEKWFVGKDNRIVNAPNQAARDELIANLANDNPALYKEYSDEKASKGYQSNYVKYAKRFKLGNKGKIELSSLFAEFCLSASTGAWGLVLPSSIVFGDSTKEFFEKLVQENRLVSLFDFENKEALFDIHRMFKFSLLTSGRAQSQPRNVKGGFYLTRVDHLQDPRRIYTIQTDDFALLNPNTKTCPMFRTSKDAELTKKIYRKAPILVNEDSGESPWDAKFLMLFNMATASSLFRTRKQLDKLGGHQSGSSYFIGNDEYMPLYEGKMIWLYNHHYGAFPNEYDVQKRPSAIGATDVDALSNPNSTLNPWYWVRKDLVDARLIKKDKKGNIQWEWTHKYYIGFRDVTNATNERTCVASLMPGGFAAGDKAPLVFTSRGLIPGLCLLAMMSSLVFDYVSRQKVGGSSMGIFIMKQLPFLTPEQIPANAIDMIIPRVMELCYFNHDLDGWAEELWRDMSDAQRRIALEWLSECNGIKFSDNQLSNPKLEMLQTFTFNPEHRAKSQAELDAIFAHLYGLTTDELRYILDPEDICGEGCINQTFRVLKDREIRELGEYRTKRLVLTAWHNFHFDN
jgi:hypothetical protein